MRKISFSLFIVVAVGLTLAGCGTKETMGKVETTGDARVNADLMNTTGDAQVNANVMNTTEDAQVNVDLINTEGKIIGTAVLTEVSDGVKIKVKAAHLTPGKHGFHIHQTGKCEVPDFKSAGEHFNPEGKEHGFDSPHGPHAGDLPNLDVDHNGKVKTEMITNLVALQRDLPNSLFKPEGTSLVIHEKPDDEKTNPSGNSGSRIACGVISN